MSKKIDFRLLGLIGEGDFGIEQGAHLYTVLSGKGVGKSRFVEMVNKPKQNLGRGVGSRYKKRKNPFPLNSISQFKEIY